MRSCVPRKHTAISLLFYSYIWLLIAYIVHFDSHCAHRFIHGLFFCSHRNLSFLSVFFFIKCLFQLDFMKIFIVFLCRCYCLLLFLLHMRVSSLEHQTCTVPLFNCHYWHALMHLFQYILMNAMYLLWIDAAI